MVTEKSLKYYNSFIYRIEKKISVEDFRKMKDYAKNGIYLYIIHDIKDNNRFLFLSSTYYEEETKISPETFLLKSIPSTSESLHLKIFTTDFGVNYFELSEEKADFSIVFSEILNASGQKVPLFLQFKTHTKKIAIDNPNWYLEYLKTNGSKSYQKKALKLLLCGNQYNPQIINHCISTFFQLRNPDYQKFNCHSFILDEGKTGKSSLIGYMGEKVDNVSVAGLYGSSDGLRGKFKGGLVTITNKTILIDEVNELVKNSKHEKVLSVLNSILENGCYNYIKQFSQKIFSTSQFMFMGNISDDFNFPTFLLGTFGNVDTLGRRIGIITYNDKLNGFKKGQIRNYKVHPYLNAISIFLSNHFNAILCNKKFVLKLYEHKEYKKLSKKYESKLKEISKLTDDVTTQQFIKSHSKSIDRIVGRSLKLWLFKHLDDFIENRREYNNHTIYEVLQITRSQIECNLINFKNIVQHTQEFKISDKKKEFNAKDYKKLNKTEQNLLRVFYENQKSIGISGLKYSELENVGYLKYAVRNYKSRGVPSKINSLLLNYGLNLSVRKNDVVFRIVNKITFKERIDGIFGVKKVNSEKLSTPNTSKKIENAYNKDKKSNIEEELDMGDLN